MGIFSDIGKGFKSLFGGISGTTAAKAARAAGREQAAAIMQGYQAQRRQVTPALRDITTYANLGISELGPYNVIGERATRQLEQQLRRGYAAPTAEEVAASPAVQFRMQQAQRALERGAAARGGLFGGAHQRQLAEYMQGLASQEYENEAQRRFREAQLLQSGLQSLGGYGLNAATSAAQMRQREGEMRAGIRTGSGAAEAAARQAAGQARASGALAASQARQQGLGNIGSLVGTSLGAYFSSGNPQGAALGGSIGRQIAGGGGQAYGGNPYAMMGSFGGGGQTSGAGYANPYPVQSYQIPYEPMVLQ